MRVIFVRAYAAGSWRGVRVRQLVAAHVQGEPGRLVHAESHVGPKGLQDQVGAVGQQDEDDDRDQDVRVHGRPPRRPFARRTDNIHRTGMLKVSSIRRTVSSEGQDIKPLFS